jgi:hypothetical protein
MIQVLFGLSILLTGLGAGIGFANIIGYMPAFKKMKQVHAMDMWQSADHYFRARMPAFAISLQVSLLGTAISLYSSAGIGHKDLHIARCNRYRFFCIGHHSMGTYLIKVISPVLRTFLPSKNSASNV